MKISSAWNDDTNRYEIDSVDVDGGLGGPQQWHSEDGDIWRDEFGRTPRSAIFDAAQIVFIDGPRKGEVVL